MYSVFESGRYLNVTLLNTFSRNKRRKNCEESRWRSQSARLTLSNVIFRYQNLIGSYKHQLMVPSTLLDPATHIRTDKATKIHTLRPQTYELLSV